MTYEEFLDYCSKNRIMINCSTLDERREFREFVLSLAPTARTEYISDRHDVQRFRYAGVSKFGHYFCLYMEGGAKWGNILSMEEFRTMFAYMETEQDINCPSLEGIL